jgi:xanthine dehydrogenase accessory factor
MKHWQELAHIAGRVVRLGRDARPDQSPAAVAAIALVTRIEGSAYRRPGARLLIERGEGVSGGVSGGCLEEDVRRVGGRVIERGRSRLLHYDTGEDERQVWGLGLGCNGQVDLVVQPIAVEALDLFARVEALLAGDAAFALSTLVEEDGPGGFVVVGESGPLGRAFGPGAGVEAGAIEAIAAAALLARRSGLQPLGTRQVFTEVLRPPPTLLICGAGDDARPLCAFATAVGFRAVVADHRPAYLTGERFPGAHRLLRLRAERAAAELPLTGETFAVVKTHSFEHDRKWVTWLLSADPAAVPYLGLLGPRSRSEKILAELGGAGRERVFAPVGLDLGADGPEQVALSVVSELLAVWSGRGGRHLRERKGSLHACA